MIGQNVTLCCDRIIHSGWAHAVGVFRPDGPLGYVAHSMPNAPIRATREEAVQDQHFYLSPECTLLDRALTYLEKRQAS